jgi:5-methylcytosine-specific restriction protein A
LEQLPFIPGQVYNRRHDVHKYGGNRQSGICPSSTYPFIFIFSGKSGHQHGYEDGWINDDVFMYTGEGQIGDMVFSRGNLALRNHVQNGKRVFLFENSQKKAEGVIFIGELELLNFDYFPAKDTAGNDRLGIKFFFKRKGVVLYVPSALLEQPLILSEPAAVYETKFPNITERKGLVTSRVGQGAYRKSIIYRWEYKCAVTGFDNLDVLIASHILPWAAATDEQRLDVDNGLLLSPTYDALFDKHLISFENDGKIILSDTIEKQAFQKLGVTGKESIQKLNEYNFRYLDHHRNSFK